MKSLAFAIVAVLMVAQTAAQEINDAPEPHPEQAAPSFPKAAPSSSENSICLMLESAARANGLPLEFFARLIWQESRFRHDAIGPMTRSGQHAQGIAQFMPGTAAERSLLNPLDPVQALPKAAEFLRDLLAQFGNLGLAAAAYNAGPRRVREWLDGAGPMPAETRNYVSAITGTSVEQWARAGREQDQRLNPGPGCGELMALLKKAPSPYVEALEARIISGSAQPWSVVLTAGFSRTQILDRYARVEHAHAASLSGHDAFITQISLRSRGSRPFYQVRVGAPDTRVASALCARILQERGACLILRTPRT